jgi:hypothetical protein
MDVLLTEVFSHSCPSFPKFYYDTDGYGKCEDKYLQKTWSVMESE